jgi:hypothetical protein
VTDSSAFENHFLVGRRWLGEPSPLRSSTRSRCHRLPCRGREKHISKSPRLSFDETATPPTPPASTWRARSTARACPACPIINAASSARRRSIQAPHGSTAGKASFDDCGRLRTANLCAPPTRDESCPCLDPCLDEISARHTCCTTAAGLPPLLNHRVRGAAAAVKETEERARRTVDRRTRNDSGAGNVAGCGVRHLHAVLWLTFNLNHELASAFRTTRRFAFAVLSARIGVASGFSHTLSDSL